MPKFLFVISNLKVSNHRRMSNSTNSRRTSIEEANTLLSHAESPKHISFASDTYPLKALNSSQTIAFDQNDPNTLKKQALETQNSKGKSQVNPFISFSTIKGKRQSKQNIVKEEKLQTLHKKSDKQQIVYQNYITSQKSSNQLHTPAQAKRIQMENGKDHPNLFGKDVNSKKTNPASTKNGTTSSQIIKKFTSQSNLIIQQDTSKRMKLKDYLFLKQTIDNQKRLLKSKSQVRFQNGQCQTLRNNTIVENPSSTTLKKSKIPPHNASIYQAVRIQANQAFNSAKTQIQNLLNLLTFENVTDEREQLSSQDIAFISQIRKIVKQKIEESVKEMVTVMSNHSEKLKDAIEQQLSCGNLEYSMTRSIKPQNKMFESNAENQYYNSSK